MNSDLHGGMAGTGAIDDVVGAPFGPLNNRLLIDGPRPRKTLFFSNFDERQVFFNGSIKDYID